MTLPTFTAKTDGVDIIYAADINELQNEVAPTAAAAAAVRYSTAHTSTATTLGDSSYPLQSIASTASATVTLPAVSTANHAFYIINRSTANAITVNNSSAAFVAYVRPSGAGVFFPDSTAGWYGISLPKFSTSTSPTNYLREDGTLAAVAESAVTFTDITTNNASTSAHGYLLKRSGNSTEFLNGAGAWAVPAGSTSSAFSEWTEESGTWTRTGNYTFTIPTDLTAIYIKGTKVRYKDGGAYEYGVVINSSYSAPNTTVTLATNSDYAMAAATITNPAYSHIENPEGYPAFFNYTVSYSCSGSMTIGTLTRNIGKFGTSGKRVYFIVSVLGTTGGTASNEIRATLPIESLTASAYGGACFAVDSSQTNGNWFITQASPDYVGVWRYDNTNFGLGASRGFTVQGFYEME